MLVTKHYLAVILLGLLAINDQTLLAKDHLPVAAVVVSNQLNLRVDESARTASFQVVLNRQPTSNVSIPLASQDSGEVSVSPALLVFSNGNWNAPQTVTLTGVADAAVDGDQTVTIAVQAAISNDSLFSGLDAADVSVVNFDLDTLAQLTPVQVTGRTPFTTTEAGGAASGSVVLARAPTDSVIVRITSSDEFEGKAQPASLTFTEENWQVAQSFSVLGVDDPVDDGDQTYRVDFSVTSPDLSFNNAVVDPLSVINSDDDISGINVTPTYGLMVYEQTSRAQFRVTLSSQPLAELQIPVSSSDPSEVTASTNALLFTPSNWDLPQTVYVQGVDDGVNDGEQAASIVLGAVQSSDLNYNAMNPDDVALRILDTERDAVAPLDAWIEGLSHDAPLGPRRALIVTVHASGSAVSVQSLSYGGQLMQKIIDVSSSPVSASSVYSAAFILNEAGIQAAHSNWIEPQWSGIADKATYTSAFFKNVDPIISRGERAAITQNNTTSLSTPSLFTYPGDSVILVATASVEGSYQSTDYLQANAALSLKGTAELVGVKSVLGGPETATLTHSIASDQAVISFVLRAQNPDITVGEMVFPDGALQACLESNFGSGSALNTAYQTRSSLNCSSQGIVNLTGLAYFDQVTQVTINGNAITDLNPVLAMPSITRLEANDNAIVQVPQVHGLLSIELDDNPLIDIRRLARANGLQTIDLSRIDLIDISALLELTAAPNNLQRIDLLNNTRITCNQIQQLESQALGVQINRSDCSPNIGDIALDVNLRSCLLETYGANDPAGHVTDIACSGRGIVSLSGIELFYNLSTITVDNNLISSLDPIMPLEQITSLSANANQIANLPVDFPDTLQTLSLNGNAISDLTRLKSARDIQVISFENQAADLRNLQPLLDIPLFDTGSQTGLFSIYLNGNSNLLCRYHGALTRRFEGTQGEFQADQACIVPFPLRVDDIFLADDPFGACVLDAYPGAAVSAVVELDCSTIRNLSCAPLNGGATSIPTSCFDTLSGVGNLINLTILDIKNNRISDLSGLSGLNWLIDLNASSNPLNAVLIDFSSSLQALKLSNTSISDVSSLTRISSLQSISLNKSNVNDISFVTQNQGITLLDIAETQVTNLAPITSAIGMKDLRVDGIALDTANKNSISQMTSLKELSMSNTGVSDLEFLGNLISLQGLIAASNPLISDISGIEPLLGSRRIPGQLIRLNLLGSNLGASGSLDPLAAISQANFFLEISSVAAGFEDISPLFTAGLNNAGLTINFGFSLLNCLQSGILSNVATVYMREITPCDMGGLNDPNDITVPSQIKTNFSAELYQCLTLRNMLSTPLRQIQTLDCSNQELSSVDGINGCII